MSGYVGRFAPSPTGPLHAGSLVAALASYCDAQMHSGEWLLRIENIDPPREVPGAAQSIIHTLRALGLRWSREIVYQSQRDLVFSTAFARLSARGLVYPCACTRSEIAAAATRRTADGEPVYPGTCAHGLAQGRAPRAWRLRLPDETLSFVDRWSGQHTENPAQDTGDIVIRRADGLWAYQLAVVVDDIDAGVTDIVRGDDLLHSTIRQIALRRALRSRAGRYLHVPVVRNASGEKLSKQTHAPAVEATQALGALQTAAAYLGMSIEANTPAAFWRGAPRAWEKLLRSRAALKRN